MKNARNLGSIAAVGVLALTLTACGGGSTTGGATDGGDDPTLESRGPITYVQGKDNSNVVRPSIEKWNKEHPDEKVTFKEQSDNADQQHDDLVQNFQAKNENYDVVSVDVIWTAEFAAKGWLQPLKDKLELDTSAMIPATVASGTYQDTLYTAPHSSDGGILYYRKDLVKTAPTTWDEMIDMCSIAEENNINCFAGQYAKYEGLTVNASEAINGAGGSILGEDGKPTLETAEAKEGLNNLVEAYKNGDIPKEAITFQEEQGRQMFQAGKLLFHRNWPYVYNLATTEGSSKVVDKLGMTALPGKDGPGASTLGGHNLGMSVYSKNKATALDFIKFMTGEDRQKFYAIQGSLAPTLAALYDDAALVKKLPYLPTLKTSIENAVPRPVTPFYPGVSKAIQDNAYAAIKGEKSVDDALKDMQAAIQAAGA